MSCKLCHILSGDCNLLIYLFIYYLDFIIEMFAMSYMVLYVAAVALLARVVRMVDNGIHRINLYPADSVVCFVNTYPLDSDLSGG